MSKRRSIIGGYNNPINVDRVGAGKRRPHKKGLSIKGHPLRPMVSLFHVVTPPTKTMTFSSVNRGYSLALTAGKRTNYASVTINNPTGAAGGGTLNWATDPIGWDRWMAASTTDTYTKYLCTSMSVDLTINLIAPYNSTVTSGASTAVYTDWEYAIGYSQGGDYWHDTLAGLAPGAGSGTLDLAFDAALDGQRGGFHAIRPNKGSSMTDYTQASATAGLGNTGSSSIDTAVVNSLYWRPVEYHKPHHHRFMCNIKKVAKDKDFMTLNPALPSDWSAAYNAGPAANYRIFLNIWYRCKAVLNEAATYDAGYLLVDMNPRFKVIMFDPTIDYVPD